MAAVRSALGLSSSSGSGPYFVEAFAAAARRFAAAVSHADLSAPVPACPGWTTYDVAVHLGNTHAWAATVVETGARSRPPEDAPGSRRRSSVTQWYAGKAGDLLAVLRASDPDSDCWNFAGVTPRAGFWPRRQTHETLMHLVDLDQAAGRDTALDPALCTDGVAEVFEVFLPRMHARGKPADLVEPVTIRTVDTDHAWTLTPRAEGPPFVAVRVEPGADLVEGTADAVLKVLWKRAGPTHAGVSYVGNTERIERFLGSPLTP